jgi:type I restriction enzyme M protein
MAINIPTELRGFHREFEKISYKHDAGDVIDTFLEWMLWGLCADNSLSWESGTRFSENERKQFPMLYREYVQVMNNRIVADGDWYDLFGTYYEAYIAGKSRRNRKGQFFTPPHICDFKVRILAPERITGQTVSDPCSGSGRFLLAFHAHAPGNFMLAEDKDHTCCLMTVCNFLMHGIVGEVVWHNSLDPSSWFGGWRVNRNLNNRLHKHYGCPHVETLKKEDSFVFQLWEAQKQEAEARKQEANRNLLAKFLFPLEERIFSSKVSSLNH